VSADELNPLQRTAIEVVNAWHEWGDIEDPSRAPIPSMSGAQVLALQSFIYTALIDTTRSKQVKPSIGRVVHYVAYGTPGGEYPSTCRAAIIPEVEEPDNAESAVGLCVLNPTGMFFNRLVPFGPEAGRWHWPERVD
jgi:hypothetical protein